MTPEQLMASILQYAIQGKLVEQRLEEGTGEELYRQIQAEKQQLIKEGKIKKEKALPEIAEDEIPFDIPESWKWVRLSELGQLKNGYAFKSTDYTSTGVQVVRISDLGDDRVESKDAVFYPLKNELSPYIVENNSFLICMTGSIGKMAWVRDGVVRYLNQRVGMFVPNKKSEPAYLWHFLHTAHVINGWIRAKTSTNGNIKTSDITELVVPLPPLAEQYRIVAKIEELLPYVDRYAAAYEKLEQFNAKFPEDMKKSILQYAIQGKLVEQRPEEGTGEELYRQIQAEKQQLIKEGKIKKEKPLDEIAEDEIPFDIPESWKWVRVGNVFNVGTGMTPLKTEVKFYQNGTIPWVTSSLTSQRYIADAETKITEYALENTSLAIYPAHTLIVAMYGQGKTRGQVSELLIDATVNQACAALGNIVVDKCLVSYTYYFFLFNYEMLRKKAEGTSQPNLNVGKIKETLIPLPPLAEQKRIVAKLEEILPLCERLK